MDGRTDDKTDGIFETGKNIKINNMDYYRIQIDELRNGEKRYIPQKGNLRVYGFLVKRKKIEWKNMGDGRYFGETEAMNIIKQHKEYKELKKGLETTSSTYKMVD